MRAPWIAALLFAACAGPERPRDPEIGTAVPSASASVAAPSADRTRFERLYYPNAPALDRRLSQIQAP